MLEYDERWALVTHPSRILTETEGCCSQAQRHNSVETSSGKNWW